MAVETKDAISQIALYKKTGDVSLRNSIVMQYSNMVNYIAISMRNLYLKYADVDDVVNECIIALMAAIDSFDVDKNVKFETYASIRIKGAVIDFIRKQDFIPRSVRSFSRQFELAFSKLHSSLGREPTTEELATEMGLSVEKYRKLLGESASAATLSFEELLYENNFEISDGENTNISPAEKKLAQSELATQISKAIDSLKEKEKQVITLYYYEKLKFADIAKVISVTEGRVCQIHTKAITKMRLSLKDYLHH